MSDVLRDRRLEPGGLQRMAAVSTLAHLALLALVVLSPTGWMGRTAREAESVLVISLGGGTPGPASGGMTEIGGRAVQAEAPADAPRPDVRPPAAAAPLMTEPVPSRTPSRRGSPDVKQAPRGASGATPSRGAEVVSGTALADTAVRGQGFGLSSGGGAGSGVRLDVGDFCCPDYLTQMIERIRANWSARAEVAGQTLMKFTIQRDGAISAIEVEKPSSHMAHNLLAQRALVVTRQLGPLPSAFPNPTLTVHLTFDYTRP